MKKPKVKTLKQVEAMKAKAVRFADDVLDDPDLADELEDEPPESYAERKHITIVNPARPATFTVRVRELPNLHLRGAKKMPRATVTTKSTRLQDRLDEILGLTEDALDPELERVDLVVKIKEIANVAADEELYEIEEDDDNDGNEDNQDSGE